MKTVKPNIRVDLPTDLFSALVNIMDWGMDTKLEQFKKESTLLKNKLMNYSYPKLTENGNEYVSTYFYDKEIDKLIFILTASVRSDNDIDYYSELKKTKEIIENE